MDNLFQDTAGATPANLPGQPVGLVKRAVGSVDASQPTAGSRPTLFRWPKGGRRNLLFQTENYAIAPWEATGAGTSTRVNGPADYPFGTGVITATSIYGGLRQRASGLSSGSRYTFSFFMKSSAPSVTFVCENSVASFGFGMGVVINPTTGAYSTVSGLSSVSSVPYMDGRIWTLVTNPATVASPIANLELRIPVNGNSFVFGKPQFEMGGLSTPYQKATFPYDITEVGVPDVWHLSNDGGDSLPVTLPAGTYGRAFVDHLGAVTVDTVVNPVNVLMTTRQADVILRQGAFTPDEIARLTAYWEGLYK